MVKAASRQNTDPKVEQWLSDNGASWEFFQEFALELIDLDRSLKNQARISAPLNTAQVEVYTESMKRGELFPPIVLWESPLKTGSFIVVDGNHRLAASLAADVPLSAYVLPASTSAEVVRLLTFEANSRHGMATSKAERQQHAIWLVENLGRTIEEAAADMNLPYAELQRYIRQTKTDERCHRLRIPATVLKNVLPSSRMRFMQFQDDDVFRTSIELSARLQLRSEEVSDLVRDLKTYSTKEEQLAYLNEQSRQQRDRLQEVAVGDVRMHSIGRQKGPRRTLMSAHNFLLKVADEQLDVLLESLNREEAMQLADYLQPLLNKISKITEALKTKAHTEVS